MYVCKNNYLAFHVLCAAYHLFFIKLSYEINLHHLFEIFGTVLIRHIFNVLCEDFLYTFPSLKSLQERPVLANIVFDSVVNHKNQTGTVY